MPALAYPSHFPPTNRWKKFFIGVRCLGPDLSFFGELKAEQAAREEPCMRAWGGGLREEVALIISRELATHLGWKTPYFIPEDQARVVFRGPSFDFSEPEDALLASEEILRSKFEVNVPELFWSEHWELTFGEVVDALASLSLIARGDNRVA